MKENSAQVGKERAEEADAHKIVREEKRPEDEKKQRLDQDWKVYNDIIANKIGSF